MDTKIPVQAIANSILYFGLLLVALLLLIGPIREILRDETVFTESYQKIKGKVIFFQIPLL
jgi:Na+-translocating ferredoxin:NAD+ oxidoreductase RnfE subunit